MKQLERQRVAEGMEGTPRRIAIVTSWLGTPYWAAVLQGVLAQAEALGVQPVVYSLGFRDHGRVSGALPFFKAAAQGPCEGCVLLAPSAFDDGREEFIVAAAPKPVVTVGQKLPGVPGVWMHNAAGVRQVMQHLHETCGFQRIAFVRGARQNGEAEARYHAFADYCAVHSLAESLSLVEDGDFTRGSGSLAAQKLLARQEGPPRAIFASNDRMALGVLDQLHQQGVKVPEEIAVVGFDDLEARDAHPPLTTVRQPVYEMGREAVAQLVRMLDGEPHEEARLFSPELVFRSSCPTVPDQGQSSPPQPTLASIRPPIESYVELQFNDQFAMALENIVALGNRVKNGGDELAKALAKSEQELGGQVRLVKLDERLEVERLLYGGAHEPSMACAPSLSAVLGAGVAQRTVMPVGSRYEVQALLLTEGPNVSLGGQELVAEALSSAWTANG